MNITLAPTSDAGRRQYLSTFLVNRSVAFDAGALGIFASTGEQASIEHVFLTHSHADHVATLPIFLENTSYDARGPVTVYGSADTLDALGRHMFNDRIWPSLARLNAGGRRRVELVALEPEQPCRVKGLRITPVSVNHTVPTFGFVIEDDTAAVILGADSAPTRRIWDLGRATMKLRAAFIECTYPESLREHAQKTGHLTPTLLGVEADKLPPEIEIVAVHIRPALGDQVETELLRLHRPGIRVGGGGETYRY